MFFPIGDDQVKRGNKPIVSYSLIALNVLAFVYTLSLSEEAQNLFYTTYGALPIELTNAEDLFTIFTSMFMHGGLMHIAGNMLFLWVFADNIEAIIGSGRFLIFYLLGGIVAAYAHAFTDPSSAIPMVGASGALSAVMGAYLIMFPGSRIKVLIFVFITRISAFVFLGIWIGQQFFSGYAALQTDVSSGVAWWAHIGGFLFGVLGGAIFRFVSPRVKMDENYVVLDKQEQAGSYRYHKF